MSCVFYFLNFSPGAYIQMAEWNFFRNSLSSTDNWNFPCCVSPRVDLRENLLCPLKGHLPTWVVIIAEIIHTRHQCPAESECVQTSMAGGYHLGIFKMKLGGIRNLRDESSTGVQPHSPRITGTHELPLKIRTLTMTSMCSRAIHLLLCGPPCKLSGLPSDFRPLIHLWTCDCPQLAPLTTSWDRGRYQCKGLWLSLFSGTCSRNWEPKWLLLQQMYFKFCPSTWTRKSNMKVNTSCWGVISGHDRGEMNGFWTLRHVPKPGDHLKDSFERKLPHS